MQGKWEKTHGLVLNPASYRTDILINLLSYLHKPTHIHALTHTFFINMCPFSHPYSHFETDDLHFMNYSHKHTIIKTMHTNLILTLKLNNQTYWVYYFRLQQRTVITKQTHIWVWIQRNNIIKFNYLM